MPQLLLRLNGAPLADFDTFFTQQSEPASEPGSSSTVRSTTAKPARQARAATSPSIIAARNVLAESADALKYSRLAQLSEHELELRLLPKHPATQRFWI